MVIAGSFQKMTVVPELPFDLPKSLKDKSNRYQGAQKKRRPFSGRLSLSGKKLLMVRQVYDPTEVPGIEFHLLLGGGAATNTSPDILSFSVNACVPVGNK